ncbi:STAS domain-containing protein [Nocardioides sp. LMS-CY]|uniref:Anti-anti-sigma factor n=1 Tax=Nocardioides soli TaxID=1036020 RepID=A0A7W4Z008_9ACTN|nr:STAS domain-containing protein [Nocardioides sp. LMS-CY]MBB3041447.1 anti-anti-sigma factor [Nocardioides soli]QWF23373.1 STAS domain-containing protein [Nocardioides sp. LMS-CY]
MDEKPYAAAYDADQQVLFVAGSVDELAGPVFREDLAKHTGQHTASLVVDLSDVEFFPSLAVGVLAVAMRQCREAGAEIEVRAREGGIVARVLTICALPYTELPAT